MRFKKIGIVLAMVVVLAGGIVGCGSPADGGSETVNPGEVQDVQDNASSTTESETSESETAGAVNGTESEEETETETKEEAKTEVVEFEEGSAQAIVNDIVIGWNLGNSLDSTTLERSGLESETCWGNPVVTKELIDMVKATGVNAIRVPVTWYNHMDPETYEIDEEWMDRVEEVVNYVLDNDLYCILNVHHDTGNDGWLTADPNNYEAKEEKFVAIWEQVAVRFADYDEKLLFEGYNEILNDQKNWVSPSKDCLTAANDLNQAFVDTIRATGGNNATRCLVVNVYAAQPNQLICSSFVMPTDSVENKIIVEAHVYQPYQFTSEHYPSVTTWTKPDLNYALNTLKQNFVDKGYPVIVGEFGLVDKNNKQQRYSWIKHLMDTCTGYGIKCFWWDNGGDYKLFDRRTMQVTATGQDVLKIMLIEATGGDYVYDATVYGDATGDGVVAEDDLVLLQSFLKGEIGEVANCDMNKDGAVDETDEALLAEILDNQDNLCANADNWNNWVDGSTGAKADVSYTENGIQMMVENGGVNTWNVQMAYKKLTFEQGVSYKISFDYSGSPQQCMSFHIMQDYGDYKTYSTNTLTYKEEMQHYEGVFVMTETTDNKAQIAFDCGASTLGVPYTVLIENLVITVVE